MEPVNDLLQSVDYQSEAIVSKMLLNQKGGTITLFAFDQGQGLSEHTAPFDAFIQVLEGCGLFTVGGVPHEVQSGQMLIMPANIPHAVQAVSRFKMMLVMIKAT